MTTLRLLLVFTSLFISHALRADTEFNFKLLKDRRTTLKLPVYDIPTKKLLIDQARLVMKDLYVNRDMKIKAFGKRIDPLPKLDKLEKSLEGMSEEDFHEKMGLIFSSQRDLHTTYELPRPYGCYRNMMPFSLNQIKHGRSSKIVISHLIDNPEFLALLPQKLDLEIGDELLSYGGKSIRRIRKEMAKTTGGANKEAVRRLMLQELSFKIQTASLMPKENEVAVVFRKKNGRRYKTSIPWVNRGRLSCLQNFPEEKLGRSQFQEEFNKIYNNTSEDNQTAEPIVTWKIIENTSGTFGVLKLSSFVPEKMMSKKVTKLIENLLKNELSGTTGLIIDLRNNPGGWIELGEMLVPLFGPKQNVRPLTFSLNVNESAFFVVENYLKNQRVINSYNEAYSRGEKLTVPISIEPVSHLHFAEQAYFKPVAIFTNSTCYSTCDMFTAQMQDHGFATIIGEDKTTGAGGANYETLAQIFSRLPAGNKGAFKKLPNFQEMSFAWRQTYRITGELIENAGVRSDYVIATTLDDINFDSRDQYLEISKIITSKLKP